MYFQNMPFKRIFLEYLHRRFVLCTDFRVQAYFRRQSHGFRHCVGWLVEKFLILTLQVCYNWNLIYRVYSVNPKHGDVFLDVSLSVYKPTWCRNPEGCCLKTSCDEKLETYVEYSVVKRLLLVPCYLFFKVVILYSAVKESINGNFKLPIECL